MGSVTCSGSTVVDGVDDGDGDRARGRERGCLAVAGVMAMLGAEAEVKGRTESTRQRRALARSGSCPCVLWRHRLTWARPGLVNASLSLANDVFHRDQ
jgi:hypothetical protein